MTIEDYLDRICQGLRLNPARTEEIRAELRAHLEELAEAGLAEGLTPAEAAAETALDSLRSFLGLPLEQSVQLTYEEAVTPGSLPDETALVTQAFALRPDLQQLALGL